MTDNDQRRPLRLLVTVGDGRAAGAILENRFLEHCVALGAEVHVLTPGANHPPFVERYKLPGVKFTYLSSETITINTRKRYPKLCRFESRAGRWLNRHGMSRTRRRLWHYIGERLAAADAGSVEAELVASRPDRVLSTDLNLGFGRGLLALSRRKGIETIGNVFSWDHPYYEQQARPDLLTCWSPVVRDELVARGGFDPAQVHIIGAPAFDPYFDPVCTWSREELCRRVGLDPGRPILLFATIGQLPSPWWDETGTFRAFLEAMDQQEWSSPPQVVLRLHPCSVDYYFAEFRARRDVVFSRYVGYCPGMRWWPSRDEVVLAGNLLRHADVCISPGSTMTVEAAIFDTPTIVPAFNPAIPSEYERFIRRCHLDLHFRYLIQADTLCLAWSADELMAAVRRALADRNWLGEGRRMIRDCQLGPLDGRATERLAWLAVKGPSGMNTMTKALPE